MRKKFWGLVALMALASFALLTTRAQADHLAAPENVTCEVEDGVIFVAWDEVEGASRYSVDVLAGYDTTGDGEIDFIAEFSFGTSDRDDGRDMSDPDLPIFLGDLEFCVPVLDEDGNPVLDEDGNPLEDCFTPVAVMVKVKALDPGRGNGRQNHPFSDWCEVDLD